MIFLLLTDDTTPKVTNSSQIGGFFEKIKNFYIHRGMKIESSFDRHVLSEAEGLRMTTMVSRSKVMVSLSNHGGQLGASSGEFLLLFCE